MAQAVSDCPVAYREKAREWAEAGLEVRSGRGWGGMNADEVEIKAASVALGGIVSTAQHRDRVTYLMRSGARAAAVVPVMMINQWIRDEAILRLLENGVPVHLDPDPAPG